MPERLDSLADTAIPPTGVSSAPTRSGSHRGRTPPGLGELLRQIAVRIAHPVPLVRNGSNSRVSPNKGEHSLRWSRALLPLRHPDFTSSDRSPSGPPSVARILLDPSGHPAHLDRDR